MNASGGNGVSVFAHLDEIKEGANLWGLVHKDGYVSCSLVERFHETAQLVAGLIADKPG